MLIEAPQREVPLAGGRNLCVLSPAFLTLNLTGECH